MDRGFKRWKVRVDRIVIDQTELKGLYNFTIKRPEDSQQESTRTTLTDELMQAAIKSDQIGPDSLGPKVLADSLKALGLQLVKDMAPVDYLVIDHVERATGN
jgi:uncharacterized protein (TIGR03435 family)